VEIRSQIARIGVGPGKTFSFKDLSLEDKAEVALGMKEGDRKVDEAVVTAGKGINGWRVGSQYGDSKFYNGDWLKRAAAARAGIYANDAVEAIYPQTRVDVDGQPLDSGKHNYTLTFAAGQLPPVNAFWSVTMYDGKTELLIKNPINRYLINSPMLPDMKKNADGSLTPISHRGKRVTGHQQIPLWLRVEHDEPSPHAYSCATYCTALSFRRFRQGHQ
jgi:hypothetical protein